MTDLVANLSVMQMLVYGILALLALLVLVFLTSKPFKRPTQTSKGERLGISEYCEIDQTRRLVLVRRDNVEHLIMIGGAQDLVIETGITKSLEANLAPSASPQKTSKTASTIPMRPPLAPVFGAKRPEPVPTDEEKTS